MLIHPEIRTSEPPLHPPYGILQLAAITDQLGHKIAIMDNNAFRLPIDSIRETIKEEQWDVIGVGGLTTQYRFIKELLPVCRDEHPDALIVGGGGFLTAMPLQMMKWLPDLDIGAIGESYITWAEILEHAEGRDWKRIKGLVYRQGKQIKLTSMRPLISNEKLDEEMPFPGYEFSPVEIYLQNSMIPYCPETMTPSVRRLDVLTSYGCPWSCSFCFHLGQSPGCQSKIYNQKVSGPAFRQHSPEYVCNLIQHLRLQYCINFVSFIDENLTSNRKWFFEFCDKLEETGLATLVKWGMVCHTKTVDPQLLQTGKDHGLCYISYGGETTSPNLLAKIGKGQDKAQMEAAITATQAAGINPIMSFIIGFPETTIDDLIGDCQFFIDNRVHVMPFFLQPYPGSRLFTEHKDEIIRQNLKNSDEEQMVSGRILPFTYSPIRDFPPDGKYEITEKDLARLLTQDELLPILQRVMAKHDVGGYKIKSIAEAKASLGEKPADGVTITKSWMIKHLNEIQTKLRDEALERWIMNLDDATKLSVNLTKFNDVELAGLRYMLSMWDIERLKKFKESKESEK